MPLTRRRVLQSGLGLAAAAALPGCLGSESATSAGTLRVGAIGQASNVVRDPHARTPNDSDFLIKSLVYDPLTVPGGDVVVAARLASDWTADDSQRTWRFTLAEGAAFHDGAPVTAEDAAWSLRRLFEIGGSSRVPVQSPRDITSDGAHLVVVTRAPNRLVPALLRLNSFIVKKGTTDYESEAIGTGPFKLESFSSGNARLVRNDEWHGGPPRLEAVEITRFDDVSGLLNAVLSGQLDYASNLGSIAARSAEGRSDLRVVRRPNDFAMPIVMRTSDGPFADSRVREAIRIGTDRESLVDQVYSGYADVANDILGTGDPVYDTSIPQRERNVARAKSLLADAGFDTSKTYDLITKEEAPGEVESAKAFATQMREIGLDLEVVVQESTTFYESTWCQAPLYTTSWGTNDSVLFLASKYMVSSAADNESGFEDAEFDAAVADALAASDDAEYRDAVGTVQEIEYERGGYVVWGMAEGIDITSPQVVDPPMLPGYGRMQLENTSMSASA